MFFEIGLIDGTHLVGSHTHAPLELRVRDGHERGERLVRFVSTSPGSRHDLHHVQNELIYQWKGFSFPETKKKKSESPRRRWAKRTWSALHPLPLEAAVGIFDDECEFLCGRPGLVRDVARCAGWYWAKDGRL